MSKHYDPTNEAQQTKRNKRKLFVYLFGIFYVLFVIAVAVYAHRSDATTINWTPPTNNTDGSPLTNLAGFKVLYGASPTQLTNTQTIASPTATSYLFPPAALAPGAWYFAVRAFTTTAAESANSTVVPTTIPTLPPPTTPNPPVIAIAGREVFYVIQQLDKFVLVPVGTLSATATCDVNQSFKPLIDPATGLPPDPAAGPGPTYFVVPRSAVTWYGTTKPLVVVARCD